MDNEYTNTLQKIIDTYDAQEKQELLELLELYEAPEEILVMIAAGNLGTNSLNY